MKTRKILPFIIGLLVIVSCESAWSQVNSEMNHERGRLWEVVMNDGWIGSLGAWDFLTPAPLGFFPGFKDYNHPVGNEQLALDQKYENCNFHNFRSGVWIVGKDVISPGAPPTNTPLPTPYLIYSSGLQPPSTYGVERTLQPLTMAQNYCDKPGFDSRMPEEMITATWNTDLGVTVTRRSYVWSYPGYQDMIIYDYTFRNTGIMVSIYSQQVVPNFPQQTLKALYFVFHSGIHVDTKSQLNWSTNLYEIMAGAFGWGGTKDEGYPYHDYYHIEDGSTLVYSTNNNGGAAANPHSKFAHKDPQQVRIRFGNELLSPAAFGWLALYASPLAKGGAERTTPKPDVLRVDSHKGGLLQGQNLDLENFGPQKWSAQRFWNFAVTPDTQVALGNGGDRFNFYTFSYGPYSMAPGDSLRFIVAEIAGVMDYNEVIAGDPNHHFPDSSMAAIRRNAAFARNAVRWGMGATVNGIPIAAQAPAPPPAPSCDALNASLGLDTPAVAVTWSKVAETSQFTDGAGNPWYNGATDVDGYRIYRSSDFQFSGEGVTPAFRGAAWTQIADIPRSEFSTLFDNVEGKYRYLDKTARFGLRYGYYVSAYWSQPRAWTSANGTRVSTLPELASSDVNKSLPVTPAPGPVSTLKIFVAPNPYVFGDPARNFGSSNPYVMEFRNLPEKATIRIYTLSGDLVRTIQHAPDARGNVYGSEPWDQKTDAGIMVAPGLYVYHVQPDVPGISGTFTGKLMIIR